MILGRHFINGEWTSSSKVLTVLNPSTGLEIAQVQRGNDDDVDRAVRAARAALAGEWGSRTAAERGQIMRRLGGLVRRDAEHLARLESEDVGKPISLSRSDAEVCARYFEYYGEAADKIHGETIPYLSGFLAITVWEPLGVTAHIVPWNYPLQMIGRSVAPALAMGNAVVLKPAEDTSLSALHLARLSVEAGFPKGAFNVVTGLGHEAGAALAAHPGINHISFTGSTAVGTRIQEAAARNVVPVTLELGGKSPQIVFADADLEEAAAVVTRAIVQNAGQTCSAGSRVLVEESIFDRFTDLLAQRFSSLRAGPAESDPDLGPLVNARQRSRVQRYIDMARSNGLAILAEGQVEKRPETVGGFFVRPTLIADVPPDHALAQEEIFGPVLVAIRFRDEAEAVRIANDSPYGLVAGVWTSDIGRALRMAKRIETGQVFINNYGAAGGIELPFGGRKLSGHGREKGLEALRSFGVTKTISIRHGN